MISATVGGNRSLGFLMLSDGARNGHGLVAIAIIGVAMCGLRPGREAHDALGFQR
jgi:hypothetical protein